MSWKLLLDCGILYRLKVKSDYFKRFLQTSSIKQYKMDGDAKKPEDVEDVEEPSISDPDKPLQSSSMSTSEWLTNMMKRSLGLSPTREKVLNELTIDGVVEYLKSGKCKRIITMAGAGISTSAGIPDFRSPGTGLYDNLQKYNLPSPKSIFDISYFKEHPEPFFQLAKELWPGTFKPTLCHYFVRLLDQHGLLIRHYTQNIDTLERVAGLNPDKLLEAHGTFHSSHCVTCYAEYTQEWIKEKIFSELTPKCSAEGCDGVVKPDIVFFGEALPMRFSELLQQDFPECDLLIVMGTSLNVQPFASLPSRVSDSTPRLLINLEEPPEALDYMMALLGTGHGLDFNSSNAYRDVFLQTTCDEGCQLIAEKMGWKDELHKMYKDEHALIDSKADNNPKGPSAAKSTVKDGGPKQTTV